MTTATSEAIDAGRLQRAIWLDAERCGDGQYRISGGAAVHLVELYGENGPICDCRDFLWRGDVCKHLLLSRLLEGDVEVVWALRAIIKPR